jgi:hypothetical protein
LLLERAQEQEEVVVAAVLFLLPASRAGRVAMLREAPGAAAGGKARSERNFCPFLQPPDSRACSRDLLAIA